jgi:hypothetical protein
MEAHLSDVRLPGEGRVAVVTVCVIVLFPTPKLSIEGIRHEKAERGAAEAAAEREIAAESADKPAAATGGIGRGLARRVPARRLRHDRNDRDDRQGAVRRLAGDHLFVAARHVRDRAPGAGAQPHRPEDRVLAMSDQFSIDTAFKLIEIVSIVGGGGLVAFRLGKNSQVVREAMRQQAAEIAALKDEIKELSKLVTEVAVQSKRLDILEQRYEELRHGEGFVFPLAAHLRGVPQAT